jgi:hypothetical protein
MPTAAEGSSSESKLSKLGRGGTEERASPIPSIFLIFEKNGKV